MVVVVVRCPRAMTDLCWTRKCIWNGGHERVRDGFKAREGQYLDSMATHTTPSLVTSFYLHDRDPIKMQLERTGIFLVKREKTLTGTQKMNWKLRIYCHLRVQF